jgi:hypothetical protein
MDQQDNRPDGQQGDNPPQQEHDSCGRVQAGSESEHSRSGSNYGDGRPNDTARRGTRMGPGVPGQRHGSADVAGNRQRESNPDEEVEGTPDGNPCYEGSDGVGHALRQGRGQFDDETFDRNTSPEGSEPEELAPGSSTDGASIVSPSPARSSPS